MMKNTVLDLYRFQKNYLFKLLDNIDDTQLYERQMDGFNSAGWILGHLCVEAEDVLDYLKIDYTKVSDNWEKWFRNSTGKVERIEGLPTKEWLINIFTERYNLLESAYSELGSRGDDPHPSIMLKDIFTNLDAWFAHHLVTHIAVHCGNISVWKKMIGLEVGGY